MAIAETIKIMILWCSKKTSREGVIAKNFYFSYHFLDDLFIGLTPGSS